MCRGEIVSDDIALARHTSVPALVGGEEIVVDPMAPGLKCSTPLTGVGYLDAILRELGPIDRRDAAALRAHVESGRGVLELAPGRIAIDAVCPPAGRE